MKSLACILQPEDQKELDVETQAHSPGRSMHSTLMARFPPSSLSMQPVLQLQLELGLHPLHHPLWLTDAQLNTTQNFPTPPDSVLAVAVAGCESCSTGTGAKKSHF